MKRLFFASVLRIQTAAKRRLYHAAYLTKFICQLLAGTNPSNLYSMLLRPKWKHVWKGCAECPKPQAQQFLIAQTSINCTEIRISQSFMKQMISQPDSSDSVTYSFTCSASAPRGLTFSASAPKTICWLNFFVFSAFERLSFIERSFDDNVSCCLVSYLSQCTSYHAC